MSKELPETPPLVPTLAVLKGDSPAHAWQCSWCGSVLYIPHHHAKEPKRGSCPGCATSPHSPPPEKRPAIWWRQPVPVSVLGDPARIVRSSGRIEIVSQEGGYAVPAIYINDESLSTQLTALLGGEDRRGGMALALICLVDHPEHPWTCLDCKDSWGELEALRDHGCPGWQPRPAGEA